MVPWWNLFQGTIVVVAFGGIVERVLESPNGTNVRLAKQRHGNMVEVGKNQGCWEKNSRERNQSQVKDHLAQRKHFGNRKSFSGVRKHR